MSISYEEGRALALFVEFYGYPFKSGDIYDTQKLWAPHYIINELDAGCHYEKVPQPEKLLPVLQSLQTKDQKDIEGFYRKYFEKRNETVKTVDSYNKLLQQMFIPWFFKGNIDKIAMAIHFSQNLLKQNHAELLLPDFLYYVRHVQPASNYISAYEHYMASSRKFSYMLDNDFAKEAWTMMMVVGLVPLPLGPHCINYPLDQCDKGQTKKFVPSDKK